MRMTLRTEFRRVGTFVLLLLVCGCVRTVTKDGLEDAGMEHVASSFPEQTYYVGSEGDYDYFIVRREPVGSTRRYRARKSEGVVTNRFGRTKDETEWREYGSELVVTNGGRISR
jgi:hypothetical protein